MCPETTVVKQLTLVTLPQHYQNNKLGKTQKGNATKSDRLLDSMPSSDFHIQREKKQRNKDTVTLHKI